MRLPCTLTLGTSTIWQLIIKQTFCCVCVFILTMIRRFKKKMGNNANVRIHPEYAFPERKGDILFDVDDENGFVMSNVTINDDVFIAILSHLAPNQILECREVCKNWCNIIDSCVWRRKILESPYKDISSLRNLPWHFIYLILHKNILRRNFIRNPYGKDALNSWLVLSNGGDRFKIEKPPSGTEGDPPHPSCFATSFHSCSKEQTIQLAEEGAVGAFMDTVQPYIVLSEWYAGRWDCKAIYDICVELLNERFERIDVFEERKRCGGDYGPEWRQITHTFKNYGPGVRYIKFYHGGVDEQFWAGHYGSKFCGASILLDMN